MIIMAETGLLTGYNIANVERVKIVTKEEQPKTHIWQTMTSFDAEPYIEEGEEVVQRVKNTIMGRIKTDDLAGGTDLTCEDERLIPEILALVDGGTWDAESKTYTGPVVGKETTRTPFDIYFYTSDRNTDGSVNTYLEWLYPSCKGSPVKGLGKDNEFSKPSYTIQSRPATGESDKTIKVVEELPVPTPSGP